MKARGVIILAIVAIAATAGAENLCPSEQETDWNIEVLLPHEQCNKFYKCTYGQPVEQDCYGDLYFNVETWQCDWKQLVDCGDRVVPDGDKDEGTTEGSGEDPNIEIEIDGGDGDTDPEGENNTEPDGDNNVQPDGDNNAQPDGDNNAQPDGDNNAQPDGDNNAQPDGDNNAQPDGDNNAQPDGDNNAQPDGDNSAQPDGDNNAQPDGDNNTEPDGENNTDTDGDSNVETDNVSADNSSDGDNGADVAFRPNGCPVNPNVHWLVPNESDCNAFYYCLWGRRIPTKCPSTLHFNRVLQVCDWPADAGCATSLNKHADQRKLLKSLS